MPPGPSNTDQRLHNTITEQVKRMAGRVLTGNGITEPLEGRYRLISSVAARLLHSR